MGILWRFASLRWFGKNKGVGLATGIAAGVTRQTALPTSSATSSAPVRSIATPTGRPKVFLLSGVRKPETTSTGLPLGRPLTKGI
jgi:hypothetical protein